MALTILSVTLAGLFFYFGFIAPGRHARGQLKAGFIIMAILAVFAGYFACREFRSVGELAELIEPVPEITDVTYLLRRGDLTVETRLSPDQVAEFYRNAANRGDWTLVSDRAPLLRLRRRDETMVISVLPAGAGATVQYTYRPGN